MSVTFIVYGKVLRFKMRDLYDKVLVFEVREGITGVIGFSDPPVVQS